MLWPSPKPELAERGEGGLISFRKAGGATSSAAPPDAVNEPGFPGSTAAVREDQRARGGGPRARTCDSRGRAASRTPRGTRGGGGAAGGGVARLSKAPAAPADQRGGGGRGRDGRIERRSQLQQDGPPAARGRAPGTSRGGRARHPLPGRLRPGEAARARRDQQHEQRLQQPGGGRRGLLLHRQDLLLQESAPGQAPLRPASEWCARLEPDATCLRGARMLAGKKEGAAETWLLPFWMPGSCLA